MRLSIARAVARTDMRVAAQVANAKEFDLIVRPSQTSISLTIKPERSWHIERIISQKHRQGIALQIRARSIAVRMPIDGK